MERKSLVRALVRSLKSLLHVDTDEELSQALGNAGIDARVVTVRSWLTEADWHRMPDSATLGALLNLAGVTDPAERLRYFDPTCPVVEATPETGA